MSVGRVTIPVSGVRAPGGSRSSRVGLHAGAGMRISFAFTNHRRNAAGQVSLAHWDFLMMARVSPRIERELKMPVLQGQPEGPNAMPERRAHTRFTASSLSYIDLGEANGGLILNLSEGGVSVQAAEVLIGDVYPRIRFHLPKSEDWIDTGGRIAWRGKTKKEAGIRFVDM